MILSCQNIPKSFGTDEILKNVSFHIEANEKAAIVGINGAGKSTLLKIIMQKETPDTGEVILAKDATIGYLAQYQDVSGHRTIYEEVLDAKKNIIEMEERLRGMEAQMNALTGQELEALLDGYHRLSHEFELLGGYTYRSEVTGILKGLGFSESEFDRQMSELSGGQKTRVSLGKLLVTKPDVLLLDEPTNHLDMESIRWLEGFLMNYKGAVVIVSHDRYFLDRVVTKVVEIFQHQGMSTREITRNLRRKRRRSCMNYLDESKLFKGTVRKEDRSLMNVPFITGNEELDAKFVKEAKEAGFENLKGHRTVGGMRASIYNAMPIEGVEKLVEFMKKFEAENA